MYSSKPVGEWRSTLASLDMPRYEVSPTDYHGDDDGDDASAAYHKTLTHIMIILSL